MNFHLHLDEGTLLSFFLGRGTLRKAGRGSAIETLPRRQESSASGAQAVSAEPVVKALA